MELRSVTELQQASAAAKKDASSLDQDDFMKLMLQQLKNQDPFKPTDNTEFISQMAQLTSVSGISEMNANLATLADSLYSAQLLEASSLIGKEVLVDSNKIALPSSGGVGGQLTLPVSSTAVNVEILTPGGEVVGKVSLGPQNAGDVPFEWNGVGLNGNRLPPGNYQIQASYRNGNTQEALGTQVRAAVNSVSVPSNGGSAQLQLKGLGTVALSQVIEIR
ncbi:flagellar hook assembly protein FlgD [Spongiibacter taiwanensis]|uniref:flagellar hook assembly protein FlgD n=1 Tax=Spongiibacter taiwanensis TaxID=1748242 RepID=UPI0020355C97|nr:flagellar hook assembly protein FlgD [Spongiibacter taiwanensis]USA43783.1 flagellar hook assembly protein FlgD [Spongiibacter taiwanensis]